MTKNNNRYTVSLYSDIKGATVWISFPVNTPMTKQQLKVYFQSQSMNISDVEVFDEVEL
jgi:hypothetical protein